VTAILPTSAIASVRQRRPTSRPAWWIGDKAPCGLHFFRRIAGFEPRFNAIEQAGAIAT